MSVEKLIEVLSAYTAKPISHKEIANYHRKAFMDGEHIIKSDTGEMTHVEAARNSSKVQNHPLYETVMNHAKLYEAHLAKHQKSVKSK